MDNKKHSRRFYFCARTFAALFAAILLIPAARAQQAANRGLNNRFLLIFNTSSEMKKRLPAVQKVLDSLFVTSMNGQMQPGDNIGVWTFDQDLRTGQFPLQNWMPQEAAAIDANIQSFVEKQRYSKTTRFSTLQPLLDQLAANSDRLTVLIFCDGENAMSGTPYGDGINQIFEQRRDGQKTIRQPLIIVLRAQLGQYTGCTVNFPPGSINFPDFPPLPPPPTPTNKPPPIPTNQTPPAPPKPVVIPSIIMINTNTETKPLAPPPPAAKLEPTNPPSPAMPTNPVAESNAVPVPETTSTAQTNLAAETNVIPVPEKTLTAQTNTTAAPTENPDSGSKSALAVGAVFLVAAGGLGLFVLRRSRKNNHASLITRSMRKK